MGDVLKALQGKFKVLGNLRLPFHEDLFFGDLLKGQIQFHRVEAGGVEGQPFLPGQILGIKKTLGPGIVGKTAGSDVEGSQTQSSTLKDSTLSISKTAKSSPSTIFRVPRSKSTSSKIPM